MIQILTKLNSWVSLVKLEITGFEEPFYHFELDDYVSFIAVNEMDEIAFVKQFRPTLNMFTLELPGGIIEKGDSPLRAASRELLEETGLNLGNVIGVLEPRYIDSVRLTNKNYTFVVQSSGMSNSEPDLSIELQWVSKHQLPEFLKSGQLSLESHAGVIAQALLFEYI